MFCHDNVTPPSGSKDRHLLLVLLLLPLILLLTQPSYAISQTETLILTDTFSVTDREIVGHTPDSNTGSGVWTSSTGTGRVNITNTQLRVRYDSDYSATIDVEVSDQKLVIDVTAGGGSQEPLIMINREAVISGGGDDLVDEGESYAVHLDISANTVNLLQRTSAGIESTLASASLTMDKSSMYTVELSRFGNALTVSVNGASLISHTLTGTPLSGTWIGLGWRGLNTSLGRFDNLRVSELVAENSASTRYRDAVLALNPVGYWRLGETSGTVANDESGHNRDGIYSGGATLGQVGAIMGDDNTAVGLDGIDDYVSINGYRGITGTDARTISAWIKSDTTGDNMPIVSWGRNVTLEGQRWTFRLDTATGKLRVESGGARIIGTTVLTDGQWHHVVVTWMNDGSPSIGDARLYVDGTLEAISSTNSDTINTVAEGDVQIGRRLMSDTYTTGDIDEVTIFGTALSATQIAALYSGNNVDGAPTANPDTATTNENVSVVIDVLMNDTDPEGDLLSVLTVTHGATGTVVNNGSNVTYTPDSGFFGSDGFTYTVSDGNGGFGTATVDVMVSELGSATLVPRTTNDDPINWQNRINNASNTPTVVSTQAEFNNAAAAAQSGDVILIADGNYSWGNIKISASGTRENPIIYTAENPGKVTLKNAGTLFKITGNWNIIGGFTINDSGSVDNKNIFRVSNGTDNRLTDITLNRPGNYGFGSGYLEIMSGADRTRFDHNTVLDSKGFIRVDVSNPNTFPQDVRIDHNTFRGITRTLRPGGGIFGVAVMQVGQATYYPNTGKKRGLNEEEIKQLQEEFDQAEVRTVFEYNTIENFNGRTQQIISNKSSYNTYRYNRFIDSVGGIGLRHGNYGQVYGNTWKGSGRSVAVFIYGMNNIVANNIFDRPFAEGAISESMWGLRNNATSPPPTGNNTIAHNTVISTIASTANSSAAFKVGFTANGTQEPITGSIYANNILMGKGSKLFAFKPTGCIDCLFTNNLYYSTEEGSLGDGFADDQNPIQGNPQLDSEFRPATNSIIIDQGASLALDAINIDFYGNPRVLGSAPDIGAVEFGGQY